MRDIDRFVANTNAVMDACELSQETVASRAGLHLVSLNRILNRRTNPAMDTCQDIATALGFELRELLDEPKHFERLLKRNLQLTP